MTGIYNHIPKGRLKTINFRDAEYIMKCSLRGILNYEHNLDPSSLFYRALDISINHSTLKMAMNKLPTIESLVKQFLKIFKSAKIPDSIVEDYTERAATILDKYLIAMRSKMHHYSVLPTIPLEYSNFGVTIQTQIHFSLKSRKATLAPLQYVFVDLGYPTLNWNTYGRFWGSVIKQIMQERGVNNIEIITLNIHSGKFLKQNIHQHSLTSILLSNVTGFIASELYFPVYGKHCLKCPLQNHCARATSFG